MNPSKPITSRNDLLKLVRLNCPTRAAERAMDEGNASVLGGFAAIEGLPGWIVQITSRYGREWLVAVLADEDHQTYRIKYLDRVPWDQWSGDPDKRRPLTDGDNPTAYYKEKTKCQPLLPFD
jgi:hypothetical protein